MFYTLVSLHRYVKILFYVISTFILGIKQDSNKYLKLALKELSRFIERIRIAVRFTFFWQLRTATHLQQYIYNRFVLLIFTTNYDEEMIWTF